MRVVIDTNVLVSAVLKDRTPEEVILFIASRDDLEWLVTPEVMAEYREVLGRKKFGLPADILRQWFSMLDGLTTTCSGVEGVDFPRDRKDAKFIACALTAQADYLITGDRDFSEAQKLLSTTILTVSQFKRLVCEPLGRP